jgi:hypothetical protein
MNPNCFILKAAVLSWLVLAVLLSFANADPGKCTEPIPPCGQTCGRAGSHPVSCLVNVSETSVGATVDRDPICVSSGTKIEWFTSESPSRFTVKFGTPHPFNAASPPTYAGNETQSPTGGKAVGPAGACYQYSVQHCNGAHCTPVVDPKVIVNSGRHPKKPKVPRDPVKE